MPTVKAVFYKCIKTRKVCLVKKQNIANTKWVKSKLSIPFQKKLKWRIWKMWGEKIKFACKLLNCLLPEHSQKWKFCLLKIFRTCYILFLDIVSFFHYFVSLIYILSLHFWIYWERERKWRQITLLRKWLVRLKET